MMRTAPFSQATDLNTASGDTLSPLLANLKHFILQSLPETMGQRL